MYSLISSKGYIYYAAKNNLPKLVQHTAKICKWKVSELRLEVKNVIIIIIQTIVCQLRCILQLNLI